MKFTNLSTELILIIAESLDFEEDLNAFSLVNKQCYNAINPLLYRRVVDIIHEGFPSSALEWASQNGKTDCVRKLLEAGVPPATVCKQPWHPIVLAAMNGYGSILRLFLDVGVDASPPTGFKFEVDERLREVEEQQQQQQEEEEDEDEEEENGKKYPRLTTKPGNPLILAINNGHTDIAHLLINHGVELEFESRYDGPAQPFALAAKHKNISLINTFLRKGCNPHLSGGSLVSAFAYAATHGPEILQKFVNAGVDPALLRPGLMRTALSAATQAGNISVVQYLLNYGVDLNSGNGTGLCRLFRRAAQLGQLKIADIFLSMIDVDRSINPDDRSNFQELIMGAATGGIGPLLQTCLEKGRSLYRGNGRKAIIWTETVAAATYAAAERGQTGSLRIILDHEASFIDDELPILMHSAQRYDKVETFSMLLERAAVSDPALEIASRMLLDILADGRVYIARALLQYQDRFDLVKEMRSEFVFSMAAIGGVDAMQFALEQGAILDPDNEGHQKTMSTAARLARPGVLKMFLDAGFDVHVVNSSSKDDDRSPTNALIEVFCAKDEVRAEETADLLLDAGLDIDQPDQETPLLFMAGRISRRISCRRRERATRYLLKKGANMFYQSDQGQNPLVEAAVNGNTGIVRIMLEHLDVTGTPLEISRPFVLSAMVKTTYRDVLKVLSRWYWPKVYPCPA